MWHINIYHTHEIPTIVTIQIEKEKKTRQIATRKKKEK